MSHPRFEFLFVCTLLVVVAFTGFPVHAQTHTKPTRSKNGKFAQHFKVGKVDEETPEILRKYMAKMVTVFEIRILATEKTPNEKILHAANVLAQYLDNDGDGEPDNEHVVKEMVKRRATLIMAATERSFE